MQVGKIYTVQRVLFDPTLVWLLYLLIYILQKLFLKGVKEGGVTFIYLYVLILNLSHFPVSCNVPCPSLGHVFLSPTSCKLVFFFMCLIYVCTVYRRATFFITSLSNYYSPFALTWRISPAFCSDLTNCIHSPLTKHQSC